jgi:hypothetical protein
MRSLFLPAVLVLALARPAVAGTPVVHPPNCTVPGFILLVGASGVVPDPLGTFSVTVRDFNNFPITNSSVMIKFYCTGIGICQYQAGLLVDCSNREVMTAAGLGGVATFSLVGTALPDNCTPDDPSCAAVYADGTLLRYVSVAVLDLDGSPGLTGGDLSEWLGDYLCGPYTPRLDYNGDGLVTGGDLSVWLGAFLGGHSVNGCSTSLCK